MSIIQQLEDLKEWSKDSTRYERRLAFRSHLEPAIGGTIPPEWDDLSDREQEYYRTGPWSTREEYSKGQLVQPGPGSQGYSGRRFSPSSSKFHQMKDGTWKYITDKNEHITGEKKSDVIKKMEKRRQDYLKKLEVQKKATAKKMAKVKTTYEGAGKHLNKVTAGPGKNIYYRYAPVGGAKGEYNKVKHFKNKTDAKNWVKEAIESTGRITDEKFLELRNKHKVMNNLEFANFLNKKTDFKGIRGEKFTPYNVRNRQLSLDVGPTGYSLDFPYSKKDVLDTLGATEDGTAKIKAWKKAGSTEEGFKKLYKTASSIKTYQKAKAEGQFKTKEFLEKKRKQQAKYEGSEKGKVQRLKDLENLIVHLACYLFYCYINCCVIACAL